MQIACPAVLEILRIFAATIKIYWVGIIKIVNIKDWKLTVQNIFR